MPPRDPIAGRFAAPRDVLAATQKSAIGTGRKGQVRLGRVCFRGKPATFVRSEPFRFEPMRTRLVDRTYRQDYSHRCSWLIPAQPTHAEAAMPMSPVIEITYCRLCGWGLRAGWMAQELLTTFADELGSVTLTPDRTGGVFEVRVDDEVIWSRKERGRFPEMKEIKQLVRDRVAPGRSLGHTDAP